MAALAINGGSKACDYSWPQWPIWGDEERTSLNDVLESGKWWYGEKVQEFEQKFAEFQGARYGITTTNGTTAIEASLLALGVGAGDEVIVPPYTFMATASAVLRVNAIPVFADIDGNSLCIDPDDVQRKITPKTKAIIPVHLAGYMADMDRLRDIARAHSLYIIEDACHAWGSQWNGKGAGGVGHCGVFSFQATKNINSGEGGIIVTDDESIADACRSYTNCGRIKGGAWYKHYVLGTNLRITEFQAAILLGQLTRLESQVMRRQSNAQILNDGLRGIPGISILENDPRMTRRSYHFYPLRVDENMLGISRDQFADALVAEGVITHHGYTAPLYTNPLFQFSGEGAGVCPISCPYYGEKVDYTTVCCPTCEQVCNDTFWIWQTVLLGEPEAMPAVIDAVRKVCENAGELK